MNNRIQFSRIFEAHLERTSEHEHPHVRNPYPPGSWKHRGWSSHREIMRRQATMGKATEIEPLVSAEFDIQTELGEDLITEARSRAFHKVRREVREGKRPRADLDALIGETEIKGNEIDEITLAA